MDNQDPKLIKIKKDVKNGLWTDLSLRDVSTLVISSRLYVLNDLYLKDKNLEEAHSLAYAIHLGSMKMYPILRNFY